MEENLRCAGKKSFIKWVTECGKVMEANLCENVKAKFGSILEDTSIFHLFILGSSSGEESDLLYNHSKPCLVNKTSYCPPETAFPYTNVPYSGSVNPSEQSVLPR